MHLRFNIQENKEINQKKVEDKCMSYKILLHQLQNFLYFPICKNIYKIENVLSKLLNFKWEANEDSTKFTEPNKVINDLYFEVCSLNNKIDVFSTGSLTKKSKNALYESHFCYLNELLLSTFSQIKKCNSTGRSLMLKDIKFLKTTISDNFAIKNLNKIFQELELYIIAWYYNEVELVKYLKETSLSPKLLEGLVMTGESFSKLNKNAKKDVFNNFFPVYIDRLELFKMSYYSDPSDLMI